MIDLSPKFRKVCLSPHIPVIAREKSLNKLLGKHIAKEVGNFLSVLLRNNRFYLFNDIVLAYEKLVHKEWNRQQVSIVTASELSDASEESLKQQLALKFNKQIVLNKKIDPSLMGGAILMVENRMLDASLKGKLERLRKHVLRGSK